VSNLRNQIRKLKPFNEQKAAQFLAQAGVPFNEKICSHVEGLIKSYPEASLFNISVVESLIWARYARREKRFYGLGLDFLEKGSNQIFKETKNLAWRFGPDKLEKVLKSWKILLDELSPIKLFRDFSLRELSEFQHKQAHGKADILSKTKKLPQMGPWIFCGPFKILGAYRKDLWEDKNLDKILMPLGFQVIRGLRFLRRQGCLNIDTQLLIEEEPSFGMDAMGTVFIAQDFQKGLAALAGSRILHINSGLFELGKGKAEGCID